MSPTKIVKALLIFSLVLWIFCIGLVISIKKVRTERQANTTQPYIVVQDTVLYQATSVQPQTETTEAPQTTTTEEQTATAQQAEPSQNTSNKETSATTEQTEPEQTEPQAVTDYEQIAKLYTDAVNNAKSMKDFSLQREDTLNLAVDEATGGTVVKNFANTFVSSKAPHTVDNLVFVDGIDKNGSGETPFNALPPIDGNSELDVAALSSASAEPNEYGGYNISLAFVDDVQTLDTPAKYLSRLMEVIDISALGLPSVINIKQVSITYSGASIDAVTDNNGRLVSMTHHLPVSHAEGNGTAVGISANIKLHGDFTCVYTFTY